MVETLGLETRLDSACAASYIASLRRLRDEFGLADDISVMSVAQNRDIFSVHKPDRRYGTRLAGAAARARRSDLGL